VRRHVGVAWFREIAIAGPANETGVARRIEPTTRLARSRDLNRLLRLSLVLMLVLILILALVLILIAAAAATFATRSATTPTPMASAVTAIVESAAFTVATISAIMPVVSIVSIISIAILILILILRSVEVLLSRRRCTVVVRPFVTRARVFFAARRRRGFG
jgi:hypothetical protein